MNVSVDSAISDFHMHALPSDQPIHPCRATEQLGYVVFQTATSGMASGGGGSGGSNAGHAWAQLVVQVRIWADG